MDTSNIMVRPVFRFIGWYVIPPIGYSWTQLHPCNHKNYCRTVALSGAPFNRSNQSSYIGTARLLPVSRLAPLSGRLSGIFGRKGAMLLVLSLFSSGTLLYGIAPSTNVPIAVRNRGHGRRRVSTPILHLSSSPVSMPSFPFAES